MAIQYAAPMVYALTEVPFILTALWVNVRTLNHPLYRETADFHNEVIGSAFFTAASVSEGVSQPEISEPDKHRTPLHSKISCVSTLLTATMRFGFGAWTAIKGVRRKCGCGFHRLLS